MNCKSKHFLIIKTVHTSKRILSLGCVYIFANTDTYSIRTRNNNMSMRLLVIVVSGARENTALTVADRTITRNTRGCEEGHAYQADTIISRYCLLSSRTTPIEPSNNRRLYSVWSEGGMAL